MSARVKPQPRDRGRDDLSARGTLHLAEGPSAGVAPQEPGVPQPIERQLQHRACEQGRSGELAAAEYQLQRAVELRPGWSDATSWRDRVKRLLDGVDADGRRLVRFE